MVDVWTREDTKWLLGKYAENMDQVAPKKKFRLKKSMWSYLATQLEKEMNIKRTYDQLENR